MENKAEKSNLPEETPENTAATTTDRRGFLNGMGVMSLAAMTGAFATSSANASASPSPQNLSSIAKLNVTREETFDVPGGKECFIEWQAGDENGVIKKFMTHHSRIDGDGTYTMNTDIKINTYKSGMDLHGQPLATTEQHISVFAIKGEITGSIRNDQVTVTVVHSNGSTTRQSLTAPVRLDTSEYDNLDATAMISKFGNMFVAGNKP